MLLGDAPYYARFGFSSAKTSELALPGPFERDRLLSLELREGALDGASGMIAATGARQLRGKAVRARKAPYAVPHAASDTNEYPTHFYRIQFKRMDGDGLKTQWLDWYPWMRNLAVQQKEHAK